LWFNESTTIRKHEVIERHNKLDLDDTKFLEDPHHSVNHQKPA